MKKNNKENQVKKLRKLANELLLKDEYLKASYIFNKADQIESEFLKKNK